MRCLDCVAVYALHSSNTAGSEFAMLLVPVSSVMPETGNTLIRTHVKLSFIELHFDAMNWGEHP